MNIADPRCSWAAFILHSLIMTVKVGSHHPPPVWCEPSLRWRADHARAWVVTDEGVTENLCQLASSERQMSRAATTKSTNTFLFVDITHHNAYKPSMLSNRGNALNLLLRQIHWPATTNVLNYTAVVFIQFHIYKILSALALYVVGYLSKDKLVFGILW